MTAGRKRVRASGLLLPVVVAIVLLWIAFRGVDWGAMGRTLEHARPGYLAIALVLVSLSYAMRSLRWRVLLSAERTLSRADVFCSLIFGYLGNNFLPARAGELIRSFVLARKTGISTSFALATALTERVMDAGVLVLISLVVLPFLPSMPSWLLTSSRVMAVVAVLGLAILIGAPRLQGRIRAFLGILPMPSKVRPGLDRLLEQFLLGVRAFQHPVRGLTFTGYTAIVWSLDAAMAMILARAFGLSLSAPQALLLLAAIGLASAVPSTPGYIGIYQFVAVTVLMPFGLTRSESLAYILALQAILYCTILVWSIPSLWHMNVWSRVGHRVRLRPLDAVES